MTQEAQTSVDPGTAEQDMLEAAAAELMGPEEGAATPSDGVTEPAESHQEAQEAENTPEEAAEAAPEEAEAPEEQQSEPEETGEPPGYRWQQYRRKLAQLDRDKQELRGVYETLMRAEEKQKEAREAMAAERKELDNIKAMFKRGSFEQVWEWAAKQAGVDSQEAFDRYARYRMDAESNPHAADMARRFDQVQRELEELRAERAKEAEERKNRDTERSKASRVEQREQQVRSLTATAMENLVQYEYLARLTPRQIQREMGDAIDYLMRTEKRMSAEQILGRIDDALKEEYSDHERASATRKGSPSSPGGLKDAEPQAAQNANASGRTISGRDAASTPAREPEYDEEENLEAAGRLLAEVFNL